jgi:hypothetical protein
MQCLLASKYTVAENERNMTHIKELNSTNIVKTKKRVHRSVIQLAEAFFDVYQT